MISWRITNGRWQRGSNLQWAPTLTAHDPNPPLSLANPTGGTSIAEADLNSAGVGALSLVAATVFAGAAASDGVASISVVGAAVTLGTFASDGTSTLTGAAAGFALSEFSASGLAEVTANSALLAVAVADAVGAASESFSAAAISASVFTSAGSSELLAEPYIVQSGSTSNQAALWRARVIKRRARRRVIA